MHAVCDIAVADVFGPGGQGSVRTRAEVFRRRRGLCFAQQVCSGGHTIPIRVQQSLPRGAGARCIFRNNDRDAIQLDLDTHYPFNFTGNRAALYPIIGLNYSWWNSHNRTENAPDEDVSTRKRNFGLNAGAGFEFTASPTLKIHIEARYSMVKSNSSAQLTAGIAYIF